ncbi:APC family permease [Brachybacterium huguangmaarense]
MPALFPAVKRILVGRAFASERLSRERLPIRLALPTFSADALSSVAYAPDQILLMLAVAGFTAYTVSPWVALAVVVVMAVVILTNRAMVREYPSGGGDFEVVEKNLGSSAGRVVGAALLVDYVLTVAVSTSQAALYTSGVIPSLHGHEALLAVVLVVLLALVNLRGVRTSGTAIAIPVYLFMGLIGLTVLVGAVESITGDLGRAPSADMQVIPTGDYQQGVTALGASLLVLRAFASGCSALTGVQAIGNGVPSFRPPKARNAGITLLLLGAISSAMMLGIIALARATGVQYVEDPSAQLLVDGRPATGYQQLPVIGQIAQAVFSPGSFWFYLVSGVTALVLFLAANTAFHGFPNLASALARADFLPRRFRVRGDRLAYSNGIAALTVVSTLLVWATGADVTLLVQVYIVGVFVSFSLSRLGMVRHFDRRRRVATSSAERRNLGIGRAVSALGFALVTLVLVIVLSTKLLHGAWAALLAMALLWLGMTAVRSHYAAVRRELALPEEDGIDVAALPSRSHAIVLVSTLDRPTIHALSVAAAARHTTLEALTIDDEDADVGALLDHWRELDVQVPLRIVYSPYRAFAAPVLAAVLALTKRNPRDVVVVYVPEVLVGHWWEWFLHNHSARRLRSRLEHLPRVVVSTVPWRLGSAESSTGQVLAEAAPSAPEGR